MFRLRSLAIALVALALAGLSVVEAAGTVFEQTNPQLAVRLPVTNGFALTQSAERLMAEAMPPGSFSSSNWSAAQAAPVRHLSLEAYRREPLDVSAIANLALVAESEGHPERARALMLDAEALSRRNLVANMWLAADYTHKKDLKAALASLDNALRSSDEAQQLLISALVQNLHNSELVEPLGTLLQDDPPWRDNFWHAAYRAPASLPNVTRLRVITAQHNLPVSPDDDRSLLNELVRNRLFSAAEQVFGLVSRDTRANGEIVRNAAFDAAPRFAPFDWQLFFDDSMAVDLVAKSGVLVIRMTEGGSGTAARELLDLSPGSYAVWAKIAGQDGGGGKALSASLTCADSDDDRPIARAQLGNGQRTTFLIPQDACRYYWLNLDMAPVEDGAATVTLDSISLRKVPGSG